MHHDEPDMTNEEREADFIEHEQSVDRVVTEQIYAIAERIPTCNFGMMLSELRGAAIKALLAA